MFDYLDMAVWTSIIATDEAERDRHLSRLDKMISAYHGRAYEQSSGTLTPENFYYTYITATVPGLVDENPRVKVQSRRAGAKDPLSVPMKHGLNRWVRDDHFDVTAKSLAVDFCFTWGVGMVTNEPDLHQGSISDRALFKDGRLRDGNKAKYRPRFYRISPQLFCADSRALSISQAAHMWHTWFASAADIEQEANAPGSHWDKGVVSDLVSSAGSGRDAASVADPARKTIPDQKHTDEVEFKSVWIPGLETDNKGPDTGHNGTIITLARTNSGEHGRKWAMPKPPEAYFGPATGPYEVFGAVDVPDKLWPMGHLVAQDGNIQELNRHALGISRANEVGKNVLLYDLRDKSAASQIKNAKSDYLIGIPNLDKANIVSATFGFASEAQYRAHAMHLDQLQRNSGINDALQGNVTGRGTATENSIANEASLRRSNALYQRFVKSSNSILSKVAHFFYWDEGISFTLGDDFFSGEPALQVLPGQWAEFRGGQQKKNRDIALSDYEIEIEMYSMGRTDKAQLTVSLQMWDAYLERTAQMRQAFPWVDWQAMDELHAQQLNMPELKSIVDNEAAAASEPFQEGGERPQTRFPSDAKPLGGARPQVSSAPPAGARPQAPQQSPAPPSSPMTPAF